MNTRWMDCRRILVFWAASAMVLAMLMSFSAPAAAFVPPSPPDDEDEYICETPVDGAAEVRKTFADHYECVDSAVRGWLRDHPEAVDELARQYDTWKRNRSHDLRDRTEAAGFVRDHPIDFATSDVELTERQIEENAPVMAADPAEVAGTFERFFVDREASNLLLTSDREGLVSLDISNRFAFEVLGTSDETGDEDFFVVDDETAVIEERNETESARDLVVLDISDRSDPREIRRIPAAIPEIGQPGVSRGEIPDRAPTFEEYRAIREGHFVVRECGPPPTLNDHEHQHCRPDGSCYRAERKSEPTDEATCERVASHPSSLHDTSPVPRRRRWRRQRPSPSPMPEGSGAEIHAFGSSDSTGAAPDRAARDQTAWGRVRGDESAGETPQGGTGGAGSLSQMMVRDSTLFVLTAAEDRDIGWLTSFDITDPRRPERTDLVALDNGPEALQGHDDLLLIAGREALMTASTAADDGLRLLGERRQECPVSFDPVVVEGAIAYRTVIIDEPRSSCRSRLEVIDLSQPHDPEMRTTEPIDRPRGLEVLGRRLFVADQQRGVRVYDVTDPVSPEHIETWQMEGVKDLVVSDFDLYAMSDEEVGTYYVGPLFGRERDAREAAGRIERVTTVVRGK